jgi:hypothetical protein
MLIEKRFESYDESGCAEAALRSIVVNEGLLDRVKVFALHQRFNRGDSLALSLDRQNRAGIDRAIVEKYGAGTTLAAVAHALGASDIKLIAERVEQGNPRLNVQSMALAVDGQLNRNFAWAINFYRLTGGLHNFRPKNRYCSR